MIIFADEKCHHVFRNCLCNVEPFGRQEARLPSNYVITQQLPIRCTTTHRLLKYFMACFWVDITVNKGGVTNVTLTLRTMRMSFLCSNPRTRATLTHVVQIPYISTHTTPRKCRETIGSCNVFVTDIQRMETHLNINICATTTPTITCRHSFLEV